MYNERRASTVTESGTKGRNMSAAAYYSLVCRFETCRLIESIWKNVHSCNVLPLPQNLEALAQYVIGFYVVRNYIQVFGNLNLNVNLNLKRKFDFISFPDLKLKSGTILEFHTYWQEIREFDRSPHSTFSLKIQLLLRRWCSNHTCSISIGFKLVYTEFCSRFILIYIQIIFFTFYLRCMTSILSPNSIPIKFVTCSDKLHIDLHLQIYSFIVMTDLPYHYPIRQ